MKSILRLIIVAALVFVVGNEPPREQAVAEVQPVEVLKAEIIEAPEVVDTTSVTPTPTPEPTPPPVQINMTKQQIMTAAGIDPNDWAAVDYIVAKESSWRHLAVNASSGATGLCQSLPASKMASAGLDYLTNPVTQLKWCDSYAKSRYGGWWQAHSFWLRNHWW